MSVIVKERDFPIATVIDVHFLARAHYKDSYFVAVEDESAGPIALFHAVFGHRPTWMKLILVARNGLATLAGLEAAKASEIMRPQVQEHYEVGGKIGAWPIYALTADELVAGRDNNHLDFRLSVLREGGVGSAGLVISTACAVNNRFGSVYLWLILPFHRIGVRWLMASAVSAKRL